MSNPSNNLDGLSPASERSEVIIASKAGTDECSEDLSYIKDDDQFKWLKKDILSEYGIRAKMVAKTLFHLQRTYEMPLQTYYIVITPYGKKKGMQMPSIIKIIKRWGCDRVLVTRETTKDDGSKINPHYNILVTTKKTINTSNSNNLNIHVQSCPGLKDHEQTIDYIFKTYLKPKMKRCRKDIDYYVWSKY